MDLLGIDLPTGGDVLVLGQAPNGTITQLQNSLLPALSQAANNAWQQDLRPMLPGLLQRELGKGDRFAEGFTLYDIDVRLDSGNPVQTIQRNAAGDLVVHVVTGRNTIVATSTQPTFLGSYADPRFSLDFALAFDFVIDVPPVTAPVGGSRVVDLRIIAPHLDSQNFAGDLLLVVGKIVAFLAGTDVDSLLDAQIRANLGTQQINNALAPLNAVLQQYLGAGYRYLSLLAGDPAALRSQLGNAAGLDLLPAGTQSLVLLCRQPDESGVIEGEISWPDSAGRPVDQRTYAIATSLAQPFVPAAALAQLQAGRPMPVPAAAIGEEARIGSALAAFTRQPAAAAAAAQTLDPRGIRLWDAAQQQEPEQLPVAEPATAPQLRAALSPEVYDAILESFRRGPLQFIVRCSVTDPAGSHETGQMTAMWYDDGDGWQRRRYRIEGVETGQPLTVTCALAPEWHWLPGTIEEIAPRNWSGTVTVHQARDLGDLISEGALQMTVSLPDGSRRTVAVAALESAGAIKTPGGSRSIIVVGGVPGDEAALNPQPLPPKWREQLLHLQGDAQAVLIAPGEAAGLNPQPLPPKWREQVVGGPGGKVALNPQPLPPKVAMGLRGPGTFLKHFGVSPGAAAQTPVEAVPTPVASAVEAHVDAFGDLVTQIDADVLIPDTVNPVGYGTARGVDFRVWPKD